MLHIPPKQDTVGAGVVVHFDVLLAGLGRRAHGQGDS
jgi:hypothetical protein